jgi:hypothetical protein
MINVVEYEDTFKECGVFRAMPRVQYLVLYGFLVLLARASLVHLQQRRMTVSSLVQPGRLNM